MAGSPFSRVEEILLKAPRRRVWFTGAFIPTYLESLDVSIDSGG